MTASSEARAHMGPVTVGGLSVNRSGIPSWLLLVMAVLAVLVVVVWFVMRG